MIYHVLHYVQEKQSSRGTVHVREDNSIAESFLILKQVGILSDSMGLQWICNQDIGFY